MVHRTYYHKPSLRYVFLGHTVHIYSGPAATWLADDFGNKFCNSSSDRHEIGTANSCSTMTCCLGFIFGSWAISSKLFLETLWNSYSSLIIVKSHWFCSFLGIFGQDIIENRAINITAHHCYSYDHLSCRTFWHHDCQRYITRYVPSFLSKVWKSWNIHNIVYKLDS